MSASPLFTVDSLRAILESGIEASEPQNTIRTYLAAREGKKLTKADEPKLRAVASDESVRITRRAGMTHIEWGGYGRSGGNRGGSLLIAYTEAAPIIVMADFDRFNVAYFGAKEERNQARQKALRNPDALARVAALLSVKIAAERELESLVGYEGVCGVERHAIQDAYQAARGDKAWSGQ